MLLRSMLVLLACLHINICRNDLHTQVSASTDVLRPIHYIISSQTEYRTVITHFPDPFMMPARNTGHLDTKMFIT
ncbi:hypothetical protein ARMGADRAFT_92455 [Armillaria gallica]|uniref:Secreted protein n=1 Tax=Armillaria gallica TaxID=47427 RepID=A0A2H3DUL9_ARMGA|nr:hypothetical protein ARMGADRAFT_92455 [Armillaria gallica]